MLHGSCHCGALTVELATARSLDALPVRTCGCTFCRKHRPRYTSDPTGQLRIRGAAAANPYRFGLQLADFLICRTCGVFVAAYEPAGRGVINIEALARADEFTSSPLPLTIYDTEDVAARTARRAANWTPATLG